ncbi:MAG: threonine--tRNA ligase [Bradymonadales bacterium]|jgi:threonyl-tRNA synthetase
MENGNEKLKRKEKLLRLRHSCSHIMAEAVQSLFPTAKFAIGPAIADGFYYDFELPRALTQDDLEVISQKMRAIIKKNAPFERSEMTKAEAIAYFGERGQDYKLELIEDIADETLSIYTQSEFVDLCAGPHVRRTGECKHFKLSSVAGAYWRGDSERAMLQRIYGTVWPTKDELDTFLEIQAEAKRRDHRKLGKELELFFFHPYAPGAVFWQPKGYDVYRELEMLWTQMQREQGYVEVMNPVMYDAELYRVSGHLEHYQDSMFMLEHDGKTMCLKPMNCPDTMLYYKQRKHSYRELPLRVSERQILHRNELSGALSGLTRVRQFTQDDAHLFVRPDQIQSEILRLIDLVSSFYSLFDLEYRFYLSTRPDDFMGEAALWDQAEASLEAALKESGLNYKVNPKDGAFYGPKIDILIQDSLGRQFQCATIQLDFQLPERFELEYITADNTTARPVVIHRAIFGSYERFIGILLEHLAGVFPTWLAPIQAIFLPINDSFIPYCRKIASNWERGSVRCHVDERSEKIGYKIRSAEMAKIPYMLVVGKKEVEDGLLNLRSYQEGEIGSMHDSQILEEILNKIMNRTFDVRLRKLNIEQFIDPEDLDAPEQVY